MAVFGGALVPTIGLFVVGAIVIAAAGTRLTSAVDRLGERTGIGEALAGAVLLGGATSIAGLVVTTVAALEGNASLAVSNAVGGIAVQTVFIVVADLSYRRANLEHAAASLTNVFNTLLLVMLLTMVVVAVATPHLALFGIHPVTPLLLAAYVYGTRMSRQIGDDPMWQPAATAETEEEHPTGDDGMTSSRRLWARFAVLGAVTAGAGFVVARSGLAIADATALSGTTVGALLTSVASSLPELVTTIAAVRSRALRLAVGGIVGGNTFDMLFVAVADVAYRGGGLYAEMRQRDLVLVGITLLMTTILAGGLVRRERTGVGFEGVAIVGIYVAGIVVVTTMS